MENKKSAGAAAKGADAKKFDIMSLDYSSRGLDICQFCGFKYNVGERIPRILVHCGHTLCTNCISELHN